MKLATFRKADGMQSVGAVHSSDQRVLDLAAAVERLGLDSAPFADMLCLMGAGERALDTAREALAKTVGDPNVDRPIAQVTLVAPVPVPSSIRDFVTFPGHILGAPAALRVLANQIGVALPPPPASAPSTDVPPVYRRMPNFYKGNRFTVVGPESDVVRPSHCAYLDYELEFGVFIGRGGTNIPRKRAREHIFGYAIFNDFSARDIQVNEIGGMTGPCKSKDFSTGNAIGPWIVTADEIPNPYALSMQCRVNGETWCSGRSDGMIHSFEDMVEYVSRDEPLMTGEFFGSGTVGGGTGMEINRYLRDGDLVELEVEGIGILRNRVVPAASRGVEK